MLTYYITEESAGIIYEINLHLIVAYAGVRQQKQWLLDLKKCRCWIANIQVIDYNKSRNLTLTTAGIRLQKYKLYCFSSSNAVIHCMHRGTLKSAVKLQ